MLLFFLKINFVDVVEHANNFNSHPKNESVQSLNSSICMCMYIDDRFWIEFSYY